MPFLSSLEDLLLDACINFQKSVDNFEIAYKNVNFKGCSTPLMCSQQGINKKAAINNSKHWLYTVIVAICLFRLVGI